MAAAPPTPQPGPHLSADLLTRHRSRSLTPAEVLAVHDHLESCAQCRAELASASDLSAAHQALSRLASLPEAHPEEAALEAHVRGQLPPEEERALRAHLSRCGPCLQAVQDLIALREALDAPEPAAPAARPSLAVALLRAVAPALVVGGLALFGVYRLQVAPMLERVAALQGEVRAREETLQRVRRDLEARAASLETERQRLARAAGRVPELERRSRELAREQALLRDRLQALGRELAIARAARPGDPAPVLRDGGGRIVESGGRLARVVATPLPPAEAAALRSGALVTAADSLQGTAPAARGGKGPRFRLRAPVGTLVREPQPRLTWEPVAGAAHYRVTLTDETRRRAVAGPPVTQPTWTPPPLEAGVRYTWQVEAFRAGQARPFSTAPNRPDPAARFQVLDPAGAAKLERALAQAGDSEFSQAIALARAGLLDEADARLSALLRTNPESQELRRLRETLRRRN
jgi:hypothetical protein